MIVRSVFRRTVMVLGIVCLAFTCVFARPAEDRNSIVIVYKDAHRQTLAAGEIARIDLKPAEIVYKDGHREKVAEIDHLEFGEASVSAALPGRNHFIGKWKVGEGNGDSFFITLDASGEAKKNIGEEHGTWTLVDGEARISWDDGWHDVIRKVGSTHEKLAYAPGKTFADKPANVTEARSTEIKPI